MGLGILILKQLQSFKWPIESTQRFKGYSSTFGLCNDWDLAFIQCLSYYQHVRSIFDCGKS